MRTLLAILILSASWLQAAMTLRDPFYTSILSSKSTVSTWYPTNIGTPIVWYQASDYSSGTLPDKWINGWNLTNPASATCPTISNNWLNGQSILHFNGTDQFLRNTVYTNNPPCEVWTLMEFTGPTNALIFAYDSANASYRMAFGQSSSAGGVWIYTGGSQVNTVPVITNQWFVFGVVYNSDKSYLLTNSVAVGSAGNPGTFTVSGFTVGSRNTLANFSKINMAEMVVYANTNTGANRSNIFWYFTNKYGAL